MKLVVLLAVAVCYFHSRCVNGQMMSDSMSDMMPEDEGNETISGSGEPDTTDGSTITTISTTMSTNGTDSSSVGGQSSGLSTGAIVGIVIGVVVFVVLVALLVSIITVLTIMKSKKTKVVSISPSKPSAKDSAPDAKLTSHGKSQAMKELPVVDSS